MPSQSVTLKVYFYLSISNEMAPLPNLSDDWVFKRMSVIEEVSLSSLVTGLSCGMMTSPIKYSDQGN